MLEQTTINHYINKEKAKRAVRQGRKATDLLKTAGLP